MKTNALIIMVISLLLFGCNNTSDEQAAAPALTTGALVHQHTEESEAIELNQGEKWKVDTTMMIHIRKMESDLITFSEDEQKDYKSLSEKLQSSNDLLTSNCTMEGKAHDELHKWLLPYIDLVNKLSEITEKTEAEAQYKKIEQSFITFNRYFK